MAYPREIYVLDNCCQIIDYLLCSVNSSRNSPYHLTAPIDLKLHTDMVKVDFYDPATEVTNQLMLKQGGHHEAVVGQLTDAKSSWAESDIFFTKSISLDSDPSNGAEYLDRLVPRYRPATARPSPPALPKKSPDSCAQEIRAFKCACLTTRIW